MKNCAIYPGSFDPMTNGHVDILQRALPFFSEITILVAESNRKNSLLDISERVKLAKDVSKDMGKVKVEAWSGLVMDYAREKKIQALIRGLRAASDFEFEYMMASMNKQLNAEVETFFMMTSKDLFFVSSTMIKELYHFGGDISPYVPPVVLKALQKKYKTKKA